MQITKENVERISYILFQCSDKFILYLYNKLAYMIRALTDSEMKILKQLGLIISERSLKLNKR